MARPLRLELTGGLYHVTSRGDVPRLQKRELPKSLEYYENKYSNQKKALW